MYVNKATYKELVIYILSVHITVQLRKESGISFHSSVSYAQAGSSTTKKIVQGQRNKVISAAIWVVGDRRQNSAPLAAVVLILFFSTIGCNCCACSCVKLSLKLAVICFIKPTGSLSTSGQHLFEENPTSSEFQTDLCQST